MSQIIRKKRKLKIQALASLFFIFSTILYLGSVTILKSYNYVLSAKVESVEANRADLKAQVANLEAAVKQLSNYDYIVSIAEKAGIKANQSNVKILSGD